MSSINNNNIRIAHSKGYFVHDDGRVESPHGVILKLQIKNSNNERSGYYRFGIKDHNNCKQSIDVHRLVGFQKFGEDALKEGIQVRHLDCDNFNNSDDNIAIGTQSDNAMDVPPEIRLERSIHASTAKRKFSDKVIEEIREKKRNGATYKQLMKEYDIKSKGTMSYIINNKYVTKK